MNPQTLKHFLGIAFLATLVSCGNNKPTEEKQPATTQSVATVKSVEEFAAYKILKTEPYETSGKAQVKCYAYLTTDTITKAKLEGTINKIYSGIENYSNFKNFSAPTVIAIYLYTSEDKATNMTESWIAMLSKSPSDSKPRISFDDMKLSAFENGKSKEKSADDIMYEKMNKSFKKHNTDLCSIYKILYDLEGQTIKQADEKYPNFGVEHSDYQTKLYKQERKKLFKKYSINDTLSSYITVFGMSYCK